ncbi:MAG: superoxide dismutase family protein [Luteolibacter sp.]|uniref:superoxide dismutase family protein n=1 Tax=Luteolibacter sp. TaxID=1962973 RepID=UPI003262E2EA
MKNTTPTRLSLLGIALGLSLAVPVHAADEPAEKETKKMAAPTGLRLVTELIAVVNPTSGSKVNGTVTFTKVKGGVEVTAKISGLEPNSDHGFHIHDFGNVTAADGTSAGGHYNPEGHQHGMPEAEMKHAGDLGNLKANAEGVAEKTIVSTTITLAGVKNAIVGRAVVVHAKADDGGQPTGNAGDRIGVGVIGIAKVKPAEAAAPAPH